MITQSELLSKVSYNKNTGSFVRLKDGKLLGHTDAYGYTCISFKSKIYKAHRLAFLAVLGRLPEAQVDHLNHDRSDNRWENLREVDNEENHRNRSKNRNNTSGVTGVSFDKKCNLWIARISHCGKRFSLGMFVSYSDAVDARKNAEVLYGYHANHGKG